MSCRCASAGLASWQLAFVRVTHCRRNMLDVQPTSPSTTEPLLSRVQPISRIAQARADRTGRKRTQRGGGGGVSRCVFLCLARGTGGEGLRDVPLVSQRRVESANVDLQVREGFLEGVETLLGGEDGEELDFFDGETLGRGEQPEGIR
jgi:hypothetical protein